MAGAMHNIEICVNPEITADQLWDFYCANDICETGYGKETATKVLAFPQEIVAAFRGDALVGIVRAAFDGVAAHLWEFSLAIALQGDPPHRNGSLLEEDASGIGARMAAVLLEHLRSLGCTFVTAYGADFEQHFFESVGFAENVGHKVYYVEERPYVVGSRSDARSEGRLQ
jgi:hypothetical protein